MFPKLSECLSVCLSVGVLWLHSNNGRNLKGGDADLHRMTKLDPFCAAVQWNRCKMRPRARKHAGVTFHNLCVNPLKQLQSRDWCAAKRRKGLQEEIPTGSSAVSVFVGAKWKKQEAGNNWTKQLTKLTWALAFNANARSFLALFSFPDLGTLWVFFL